ncbi:PEP/pyruvate-binding domain-containing protein [Arthrobacter mobilis]|uniref:Phosphoenolpyruvate synthase n=1 Tax=Arthrobacter mobilis TaxID=2724944 RepID=A0A7X6QMF9_9MICC|nr:PEP/pyruvate-binding domain-containing protein [Arthrobacter mobilis]NKX56716.1 phosphoenolpyruvate synthase [Arthrobacter mobilis]
MTSVKITGTLAEFGAADLPLAGGKGANLGELVRAGFPVPDGFIITTAAYRALLAATPLGLRLEQALAAGADGTRIRALFSEAAMPEDIRARIAAAYARLGGGPVAVRSSATAEDLPGAAFAGQQDTYLDVAGEDAVLDAVARCWASLWTDRAIAYRRRQGIGGRGLAIAVVVQRMVPAEAAGVMFTANPVTGDRDETVIDAAAGTGEAVVSGTVTPEHYVLDGRLRLREASPGRQVLSAGQLRTLAVLGRRVQAHFGRPQDLEWAVAGGRIHLLQARPMTALPQAPQRLNWFQRKVGPFFAEMFQERPYPLDVSGWLDQGLGRVLRRMAGSVGMEFPPMAQVLPEEDGVVVRLVPPVPRPTLRVLGAPLSVARRVDRYNPARWTQDPRFAAYEAAVRRLAAADLAGLTWSGLVRQAWDCFAALDLIAGLRVSYLPGSFVPQLKLRLLLLLLGVPRLGAELLAGAETRTTQANRALAELATLAGRDPLLRRAVETLDPPALLHRVRSTPEFAAFHDRFRDFLAEYGHRETVSVVLCSAPTWSDAPEVVFGLVKALLGSRAPAADRTGQALRRLAAHPALRARWLRRQVFAAVERTKTGIAFREDTHFHATRVLPPLRHVLLEMGRRLQAAGVLEAAEDVFHLRFEELDALEPDDGGTFPAADAARLRAAVLARAANRRELAGVPLLDASVLFGRRREEPDALLTGSGASRGTATGPVRLVLGPEEFGRLEAGDVLVCPYTNPAWTPLFQHAAAVVVDTGGVASHAAIVAREYGIPAVMGTGSGTRVLRDGQQVLVDGTLGRVTAKTGG